MDISYFQKINNSYRAKSKQETDLFLLNRHVEESFADSIDYHRVKRNGNDYELLIIRDTDGNTFKKKIKSRPSQPFNLGDYINWNGQIWLVTVLDTDVKTYCSGYMYLCNILLHTQDQYGDVVERFCYAEDYTKYSTGETGNNVITRGEYQYGVTLPSDLLTRSWKRGRRFVIDYDGNFPPDVYVLTNRKAYLNDDNYFNRGGVITFTLSYDFFNPATDKLVSTPDGSNVWICDYKEPDKLDNSTDLLSTDNESNVLIGSIVGDEKLKVGIPKIFSASFTNAEGPAELPAYFSWDIISDFNITETVMDNRIKLFVDDESLVGKSFVLRLIYNNNSIEKTINISQGF